MNDCIFCKIVAKEIPANIVYEDDKFVGFLDIHPVRKGHVLIIPKNHFEWIQELPDDLLKEIAILQKKIILAIKKSLGCDYCHVVIEGEEVPHVHIHLIPSTKGIPNAKWNHVTYDDTENQVYATKIKAAL